MKLERQIMGMQIRLDVPSGKVGDLEKVFAYFDEVDVRFSPYKESSEVSRINRGELEPSDYSDQMKEVLRLSEQTKQESSEYFEVWRDGKLDPSGLVKGWAIHNAAKILHVQGYQNFYIEAGGDIEVVGKNNYDKAWKIGIRNPFKVGTLADVVCLSSGGVATSGTYLLGDHIYNPKILNEKSELASLTVIGPNVYEADRMATAAFAMGRAGLEFIENRSGLEGLMIDTLGRVTETLGWGRRRC